MKKIHYYYTSEPLCLKVFTQGKRPLGVAGNGVASRAWKGEKLMSRFPARKAAFFIFAYENS
jgi:hypothetical protein